MLDFGVDWKTARHLPYEDVACILHHTTHRQQVDELAEEARRLASLPLVDQDQQHQALLGINHRIRAELERFHRPRALKE